MGEITEKLSNVAQQGKGVMREVSAPAQSLGPVPLIPDYAQLDKLEEGKPQNWKPSSTHKHPTIHLADPTQPIEPSEDRSIPYVLRGRHAEFNRLAQLLEQPPRAIHLITDPPSNGKSTLLEALRLYA